MLSGPVVVSLAVVLRSASRAQCLYARVHTLGAKQVVS